MSKAVSKVFKLIYFKIDNFHRKFKFLSNYNKFWVLQNVDLVTESIATNDFSTLYIKLPHDKLIKSLCNVIDFVFEGVNIEHTKSQKTT